MLLHQKELNKEKNLNYIYLFIKKKTGLHSHVKLINDTDGFR